MIKIAFFDVGETLIHDGQPFPWVTAALAAIAGFETHAGEPLILSIISDYLMPDPPRTEEKILALEEQYRDRVLGPSGLSGFFQPFESRVTISSRAGVSKPDRKIFEKAVIRSGTGAKLNECLFVTENSTHLQKCKEHGITPVRFGPAMNGIAAFEDWADAPAVIAGLVTPGHAGNWAAAAAPALDARHELVGFTATGGEGGTLRGRASRLVQLSDPRLGPLDGIYIELPTVATVEFAPDGRVRGATAPPPEPEAVADAVNFVASLVKSRSVAIPGEPPSAFGVTHAVELDPAGRRRLVRRRYSAH